MKQARQELSDEAMQSKLDSLVEKGLITQEQADEYLDWRQSRPEAIPWFGKSGFGKYEYKRGYGRHWKFSKASFSGESYAKTTILLK